MARVTGSHLICKALKLEGVKNIFALAGDHILRVGSGRGKSTADLSRQRGNASK